MGKIRKMFITYEREFDAIRIACNTGTFSIQEAIKKQDEICDIFENEIIKEVKKCNIDKQHLITLLKDHSAIMYYTDNGIKDVAEFIINTISTNFHSLTLEDK